VNSKEELKAFAKKREKMGSYLAFMMLDFAGIVHLRNGIDKSMFEQNPWVDQQNLRCIHLARETIKFKPSVANAYNPYGVTPWVNSRYKLDPVIWKKYKKKKKSMINNNSNDNECYDGQDSQNQNQDQNQNQNQDQDQDQDQDQIVDNNNPFGITHGNYYVPFFICEVLNDPSFENDEDDAKKGWIFPNSREDLVPLFLVFLEDNLTINEISHSVSDVIAGQHFEERIQGMWKVVRWLVMGARALTWILEFHSILQGLPTDLVLTVCTTMINGGLV